MAQVCQSDKPLWDYCDTAVSQGKYPFWIEDIVGMLLWQYCVIIDSLILYYCDTGFFKYSKT